MNASQGMRPVLAGTLIAAIAACCVWFYLIGPSSPRSQSGQSVTVSLLSPADAASKKSHPTAGGSSEASANPANSTKSGKQVATLAAGCFWSMEAIFKQLKGVEKAVPGYSGGKVANPSYEQVETGETGHAESLQITFDPKILSYHDLLRVYFTVRDPTTLNKQGPDEGTQYRAIVFYHNAQQKEVAQQVMREISAAHVWNGPLVTELVPYSNFYRAEDYHLNYYNLHPDEPYCKYVIAPEIESFRAKFTNMIKS